MFEENLKLQNLEDPGSKKHGFVESLKAKWQAHVERNKQKAEIRKQESDIPFELESDENVAVSDKAQAEAMASKISATEKKKKSKAKTEQPLIIDADFFEDFEPTQKNLKKLTPAQRKAVKEAEKIFQEGISSIKDLIAPASMEISPTELKLNGKAVKSFYVYAYPRYLEANWLNQIINFDATLDIAMFVYPAESARMLRVLRRKVSQMRSSKRMNSERGMVNDVALDTALEDAEQLRVDLQRGTEKFFQLGLYITVYAENEDKLDTTVKQLQTLMGGQLIMTHAADFQTERAFSTTLPQCEDSIEVLCNMNTGPLSTTFPFVSTDLTSNEGILYGLNRHNNSLIIFDRFNLANANSVTFAQSGAGKSYAIKLEILRSMMLGTDVIILDPENEYETLTRTIGGTYVNLSLTSQQRINPFDLPLVGQDENINTQELIRENIITLSGLLNLMLGKLDPVEDGLMDKALATCYEIKGITADTPNPHEYAMPTMVDLHSVLSSMEGGKNLAMRLEKYTHGTFSGLFSDQSNVDLGSGLICFCIRDLEEQLRPIVMYSLLNFIWARVRSELKRRLLIVDEAWNIVQHEDSGRFLHNLVKRARKYYLGIATITQDVEDFMDSSWGKPIITNSSMQLLLKQSPAAMDKLQPVFNLTEQEKYLLLNSGVGQGLFFAGDQHVAIQIIASYGEDKIVTTNPEEILAQQK